MSPELREEHASQRRERAAMAGSRRRRMGREPGFGKMDPPGASQGECH